MGESPDRVLRDGERAQERERERTGTAAGAGADPDGTAGPEADAAPGDAPEKGARRGSTVQLRVRDVDSKTTMLRLPVDSATTALRLPEELTKPAAAGNSEGEGEVAETAEASAAADAVPERPVGADPRLAMRTAAEGAAAAGKGAAGSTAAAGGKTAAEGDTPGASAPAEGDAHEAGVPESDEPESDEPGADVPEADALGTDAPKTDAPKEAATESAAPVAPAGSAGPAEADSPAEDPAPVKPVKSVGSEKLEKLRPLRAPAAPAAGTVPEPPAPSPVPEPSPVPDPVPEPHPAPKPVPEPEPQPGPEPLPKPAPVPEPGPAPAPEPLPTPDPRPVPPVPPLPKPEPLPAPEPLTSPENTSEAMEVLATLNARPVSPLRRALKRVTIWTVFLAVVLGAAVVAQLLRPLPDAKVRLTAASGFSFGGDQLDLAWPAKGQSAAEVVGVGSLGSSGPETPASIASVTKVMNAYLILQKFPLKKGESGPKITVDKQAAQESGNVDESKVPLTEGQVLTEYQALEMLMLPSANNVARLLARFHSGSEEAFVKLMNETATKFGMGNTTYADPAGFNADTKSTAKDQLKLAEQVMQDEIFRQIVSTPDTTLGTQKVFNTNTLINPKAGIIGVKTGSSTPAGGCLMWAAYKEIGGVKRLILGVTLGQQATSSAPADGILPTVLKVSGKQIQAAQNGLTGQTLAKQGDVVGSVEDGLGGKVPVVATKDLVVAGFPGVTGTLSLDAAKLGHTAKAGQEVGTLWVGEGEDRTAVPVALQSDLNPPSIQSRLTRTL
ncbi:hypothetical protein [Kitasatospora sp. NPDC087314]|uniref:hypothetical protein n=1 Tax=Kitasatospora sp. NPDC087314 TaxID=3364068 RepID=UPI00381243C7